MNTLSAKDFSAGVESEKGDANDESLKASLPARVAAGVSSPQPTYLRQIDFALANPENNGEGPDAGPSYLPNRP